VLFEQGEPRDFSEVAVVETTVDLELPAARTNARSTAGGNNTASGNNYELCRVTSRTPHRIEFRCQLEEPGLIVVNDLYYPGWRAYLRQPHRTRRREVQILRTNRVMRSVYLPAGDHVLEMEYRPTDFYAGAWISSLSWVLVVLVGSFGCLVSKLRLRTPS